MRDEREADRGGARDQLVELGQLLQRELPEALVGRLAARPEQLPEALEAAAPALLMSVAGADRLEPTLVERHLGASVAVQQRHRHQRPLALHSVDLDPPAERQDALARSHQGK